jgi:hypothetical protein
MGLQSFNIVINILVSSPCCKHRGFYVYYCCSLFLLFFVNSVVSCQCYVFAVDFYYWRFCFCGPVFFKFSYLLATVSWLLIFLLAVFHVHTSMLAKMTVFALLIYVAFSSLIVFFSVKRCRFVFVVICCANGAVCFSHCSLLLLVNFFVTWFCYFILLL